MPLKKPDEIKLLPAYTLTDAARYVGSKPSTLGRWFRGRPVSMTKKGGFRKAAVKAVLPTQAGPREPLSFIDLIEAHVLLEIRKVYKFPMRSVVAAMEHLATMGGDLVFLAHRDFYYDHTNLFLGKDKVLLSLSERGQLADKEILKDGLKQIEYGKDGYADHFYPALNNKRQRDFVIKPTLNFGRLSIARLGIGADALWSRYNSGWVVEDISKDYGISNEEVVEAIRWHDRLAA